jgi:uncharacterized membrane protein YqjE
MICGLCGTDIKPGLLTCPACQATHGPLLTLGGIALFVPAFLLLFAGFMAIGEGLIDKHGLKALTAGILCLVAAVCCLWMIFKTSRRGWRTTE